MNRVGRYFRSRLHRQLFLTFGFTILVTAGVVFGVMHALGGESSWRRDFERGRTWVGHVFAVSWDDPGARDRLAQDAATDLDVDLTLNDRDAQEIGSAGLARCDQPRMNVPVVRNGQVLGSVGICWQRHKQNGWKFAVPLFLGIVALWGASGIIARRLTRPIGQLARVAEDIGRGKLASRVRIGRYHGEVRVLGEVLNDMAVRIEKQLADQRALLATVSHEIRTPLARMRLLVEFARDRGDKKTLDEIDDQVVEIDALVSDLLANSRIDFGAVARRTLDATEIARQAMERAGVDGAKLELGMPHVTFQGDATLVARAVANLIENANRHGGGLVAMRVAVRGKFVAFEVDDAGNGFAAGEEKRIFEPFYRRPSGADADTKSVGLGLTLAKRIAEAHGGRAYAQNREGGGARVGVELALHF
jgi:signal transduction histidine kinase